MKFTDIKTAEEYIDLVGKYLWLVDSELQKLEANVKEHPEQINMESLPKLISMINVIGYLRGQDGAFLDSRPEGVGEYQTELYKNEDAFENRLNEIIKTICANPKNLESYKGTLERYFLKARIPN